MRTLCSAALAILLWGISCSDGPTGGDGDSIPPRIVVTTPADGDTGIAVTTVVTITFSERVDSLSVTSTSLALDQGVAVTYSFSSSTVTLVPVAELTPGTMYTLTATTAIRDQAGNRMAADTTISFTTAVDPNAEPPTVLATSPVDNATGVAADAIISASFSKGMDTASLTTAFSIDHGVTGTLGLSGNLLTFTPDDSLAFDTTYTVTISIAAADTFGLTLATPEVWSFTVMADPATPVVTITSPEFEDIVGDTLVITSDAASSVGIDSVRYFINSVYIGTNTIAPYAFTYVLPSLSVGAGFALTATAYADNQGVTLAGSSPQVELTYLWEFIGQDNPTPSTFLNELYARSSDSVIEFRVVYWDNWNQFPYPYDTTVFDSALDSNTTISIGDESFAFAMYLDTDQNSLTGRDHWLNPGTPLNGMGADLLAYVGLLGGDTTLVAYNAAIDSFNIFQFDTTGLATHRVYPDTNVFEIGFRWSDLQNSSAIDIMLINADFSGDPNNPSFDYFPELGTSVFTIPRENRYKGAPGADHVPLLKSRNKQSVQPIARPVDQPFD